MEVEFRNFKSVSESERLLSFLISETWPYHVNQHISAEVGKEMLQSSSSVGDSNLCFWVTEESGQEIGFLRIFDLDDVDDGTPLFDIRILKAFRGRGIGKTAVRWLTNYLFNEYSQLKRIAGTTRSDNLAMRRTFAGCDFVKEGHYRSDWVSEDGKRFDTVQYAIIREDWQSGKLTPVDWNDQPF